MRNFIYPLLVALLIAACAARSSNPVQLAQPSDERMTCEALSAEITRNTVEAARLAGADQAIVGQNVAAGMVGTLIFWPALFAMDLSNAEQIELRALQDRNQRLEEIQNRRSC